MTKHTHTARIFRLKQTTKKWGDPRHPQMGETFDAGFYHSFQPKGEPAEGPWDDPHSPPYGPFNTEAAARRELCDEWEVNPDQGISL